MFLLINYVMLCKPQNKFKIKTFNFNLLTSSKKIEANKDLRNIQAAFYEKNVGNDFL